MSFTKTQLPAPRAPRSKRSVILAALVGFVLVNAVAAVAVRSVLQRQEAAPAVAAPSQVDAAPEVDPAREHRLAGLDAMERGDYATAITELTRAARAGDDTPELLRLLSLAQDLRTRESTASGPAPAPPAPVQDEVRELIGAARRRAERRAPATAPRRSSDEAEAEDETAVATPTAATGDPEPVVATTVTPPPPPLPPSLEPAAAPASPPVAPPPVAPQPPPAVAARPSTLPPVTTSRSTTSPTPPPSRALGELEVLSPNVPGEVWVNGRSYGLAPRLVREIPVGRARVEIRVDGVVRRSRVVEVREGQRSRVPLL